MRALRARKKPEVSSGLFGVRATGIEPVSHAWEARVLPLNDARVAVARSIMCGGGGVKSKLQKSEKMTERWRFRVEIMDGKL